LLYEFTWNWSRSATLVWLRDQL